MHANVQGPQEQIEYDAKGLKCLGKLNKKETEALIRDMVETAKDFIDENIAVDDRVTWRFPPHD